MSKLQTSDARAGRGLRQIVGGMGGERERGERGEREREVLLSTQTFTATAPSFLQSLSGGSWSSTLLETWAVLFFLGSVRPSVGVSEPGNYPALKGERFFKFDGQGERAMFGKVRERRDNVQMMLMHVMYSIEVSVTKVFYLLCFSKSKQIKCKLQNAAITEVALFL